MDEKPAYIRRSPRDPFYQMVDNGNGQTYPLNEGSHILTYDEWQELKARIDTFYHTCEADEITEYNREVDASTEKQDLTRSDTSPAPISPIPGYVYLMHGIGTPWYKIGLSVDTRVRLKQLGTRSPFRIKLIHSIKTNDMSETEAYFHRLFNHKRAHGEWFTLDQADIVHFCRWESVS